MVRDYIFAVFLSVVSSILWFLLGCTTLHLPIPSWCKQHYYLLNLPNRLLYLWKKTNRELTQSDVYRLVTILIMIMTMLPPFIDIFEWYSSTRELHSRNYTSKLFPSACIIFYLVMLKKNREMLAILWCMFEDSTLKYFSPCTAQRYFMI